ncbi:MAG: PhoH family protein, partial [Plesiomonas shigelloides]
VDLPRGQRSGLRHAIEVLKDVEDISFNFLMTEDIVRHPVVARVVQAYEVWDAQDQRHREEKAEQRRLEALALSAPAATSEVTEITALAPTSENE